MANKKSFLGPLSIGSILCLVLFFTACKSSLLPYNTTIDVKTERLTAVDLSNKRVLVVSYDSELTREFVISLRNYVSEAVKNQNITVERINIRQNEATDATDFTALKNTFKPDYLLTINVKNERGRNFRLVGKSVKKLRDMTIDFNLLPHNPQADGTLMWTGQAVINHLYDTESVTTAKKIAKELGIKMRQDLIPQ